MNIHPLHDRTDTYADPDLLDDIHVVTVYLPEVQRPRPITGRASWGTATKKREKKGGK